MALGKAYKSNFETLRKAALAGDLLLMECKEKTTQKKVAVVCCVNYQGEEYEMVPVAMLFDDNPYDLLSPPGAE